MNLYFLVEGAKTEEIIYPMWLNHLLPTLTRVENTEKVSHNNYYLISGNGFPSLFNHLKDAIAEVNEGHKFNYLIVCIDAENDSVADTRDAISTYLHENNIGIENSELKIFVQYRCMETWFLGNTAICAVQPNTPELIEYMRHYNVRVNDPEFMPLYPDFDYHAHFHLDYLRKMLAERHMLYRKNKPEVAGTIDYLNELLTRISDTSHLRSFADFISFCAEVKQKMETIT